MVILCYYLGDEQNSRGISASLIRERSIKLTCFVVTYFLISWPEMGVM